MSQGLVIARLPVHRRALHISSGICKVQQHPSLSSWAPSSQGCRAVPAWVTVLQCGVGIWHESQLPSPAVTGGSRTHRLK